MNTDKQPNILVVRFSSLGDIVLSSPVYKNIKAAWPNARITLLVKPAFSQALAGHPDIDEILVAKPTLWGIVRQVRAGHYTHYLDLHATFKSILVGWLSHIPNRARYDKNTIARRIFVKFHRSSPVLEKHSLEKYLEVLKVWNIPVKYKEPKLGDWAYRHTETAGRKIRKIGIFQTSFIGDSVLTTPLIQKTKKLFPDTQIVVITRPQTEDIFKPLPEVSEVILNDKRGWNKIAGVWKTAKAIKKSGIDILLVPRTEGEYTIPAISFVYFDTRSSSYKTLTTEPMTLKVTKGKGGGSATDYSQQSDKDIHNFMIGGNEAEDPQNTFFGSTAYLALNGIVLAIFIVLLIIFRRRAMELADITAYRGKKANKKANKVATKRLKKAAKLLKAGKTNEFYDEVLRALWGYVGDKLAIPVEQLTRENISEKLATRKVSDETIGKFIEALDECEFARYAPGDPAVAMEHTYDKASEAIENIENNG